MDAHQANALSVAQFLEGHKNVKKVYYPGLESHPQYKLIKKQMKGFGGMVSFELDTSKVSCEALFKKLKYFSLAESLGGVESLIEHPWLMSHASMGEEGLKKSGITKRLKVHYSEEFFKRNINIGKQNLITGQGLK